MSRYIVTFGQIHTHRVNGYTFDKDSVAVIKADDYDKAREIAFNLFDGVFHQCIDEEEFDHNGYAHFFPRGKYPANFSVPHTMEWDGIHSEDFHG